MGVQALLKSDSLLQWHPHSVSKAERAGIKSQRPCLLWFTGLSGSGKSTLANRLERRLWEMGKHTYLLDGDNIRHGLNRDLGFSDGDRRENIRRIGEVAKLFIDSGLIVLAAFISPFRHEREQIRTQLDEGEFIEIFVDMPLPVCEARDPKGLYRKARRGELRGFTGIDAPYEAPDAPEIHLSDPAADEAEQTEMILRYLKDNGYL